MESQQQERRSTVRRREDDILYWSNAAKAFARFLEHLHESRKPYRADVLLVLSRMQKGEHPFAHHRNGTLFGESVRTNTIPSWQVISCAVKDGFGLKEEEKPLKVTLEYRARCLTHAMNDFDRGYETLAALGLLAQKNIPDTLCHGGCDVDQASGTCAFHKNKLAKQAFVAQSRMLVTLPLIISGLERSVQVRT